MDREPKSVDISDFIAEWPKIIESIDSGTTTGVDVTRDGRVIAIVRAPRAALHGYLRGSVHLPEGIDLTSPAFEGEIHADQGRLHE